MSSMEDTQDALQELRASHEKQAWETYLRQQDMANHFLRRIQELDRERADLVRQYERAAENAQNARLGYILAQPQVNIYQ